VKLIFNKAGVLLRASQPKIIPRSNLLFGFVGQNDTGKSVELAKKALIWKQSKTFGNFKIVAHDPHNRFPFADYFIESTDDKWPQRLKGMQDYLLILDDYKTINENNTAIKGLPALLSDRVKCNIDIMYSCHNPALVINMLTYYTTHWFIFYLEAQEGAFQRKIPNYTRCLAASITVNNYIARFGFPGGSYPNFPHCVVNNQKRTVSARHMDEKNISKAIIR
jgi:hypothetical protein